MLGTGNEPAKEQAQEMGVLQDIPPGSSPKGHTQCPAYHLLTMGPTQALVQFSGLLDSTTGLKQGSKMAIPSP